MYRQTLEGKTAIVTGVAKGIGRAIAERYCDEGAQVYGIDMDEAGLKTIDKPGFVPVVLDLRDSAAVKDWVKTIPRVDILVNNAAWIAHKAHRLLDVDEEEWDEFFEGNVKIIFTMCKAVMPGMIEAGGGVIINMGSCVVRGWPRRGVYTATKGAVLGLTTGIAIDYLRQGIRCNAVCPGPVETETFAQIGRGTPAWHHWMENAGRITQPSEVAGLCVYLASDDAKTLTGEEIHINSGTLYNFQNEGTH
ncbi:unnamed protein product [Darwinula stevensoni]|uniref:Dehydrogenase/reductase SDR family member 6 n=1 Tax=Darwinula stevensoni TaxID=69355 RepID=A0A7R8X4L9_9CRUS|nr:unnamed protein product [Darwinula stevensoni]CAG0883689.1 unnamed protein product [Darwinula stevensoni]